MKLAILLSAIVQLSHPAATHEKNVKAAIAKEVDNQS
jgi:hypothetical protein